MYEARGKNTSRVYKQPQPDPEFSDLHLKTNTIKRLRYFSTMDNESYDTVLNRIMDVIDGKRRHSIFEPKEWLRDTEPYRKLLPANSSLND
jgi:hypothetical protein